MEFNLTLVPKCLLVEIFNKLSPKQFQKAFAWNSICKKEYERSLSIFYYTPIYYLDKIKRSEIVIDVSLIKDEYINAILKNIQNGSFHVNFMVLGCGTLNIANLEKVLSNLETKIYWQRDDPTCVFAEAPQNHIFSYNKAIFTIKNKNGQLYSVKLREYNLDIEPTAAYKVLDDLWDAARNSSSYPLPSILNP